MFFWQYKSYLLCGTPCAEATNEDKGMAIAETTSDLVVPDIGAAPPAQIGAIRQRRVSPEAGRALEILGHAIEYLSDEYIYRGGSFSAGDSEIEAMQTLMGANRQIYFGCPEMPSTANWWRSLLHIKAA
jgi:hypothetical protein